MLLCGKYLKTKERFVGEMSLAIIQQSGLFWNKTFKEENWILMLNYRLDYKGLYLSYSYIV